MKRKIFLLGLTFILLVAGIGLLIQGAAASESPSISNQAAVVGEEDSFYVQLNEVMPKPDEGQAAWVELYVGQTTQIIFLPVIAQTSDSTTAAGVESQLPYQMAAPSRVAAAKTIDLSGWQVTNELGKVYTLPEALPPLPRDVFVLIYFDEAGSGANDYDASDGTVELHTSGGLGDVFADQAGQVGLYRSGTRDASTIVDFVAWGGFSESAGANAVAAGVWGSGQSVSFENGFGDISQEDILEPNESIGRFPGSEGFGAVNWANYPAASLTPGDPNPVQPVLFVTPEDGASVEASTLSLSWRAAAGAEGYQFQLDDQADFSSPLINASTEDTYFKPNPTLADGVYYWRVNPIRNGEMTSWTSAFMIEAFSFTTARAPSAEVVLGIDRVRQNKDSRLLGLDGAPEGDPTTDLPENAWDAPAPCTEPPCTDTTKYAHGSAYCVRASIRMMASWYSGSLTMDRISYHVLQEWSGNTNPGTNDSNPDNDLGYTRGMYYPDEEDEGISWALNTTINTPGGKPAFSSIKTWIDNDRPIMFRNPGHMMVMDGYKEESGKDYIHVLDPDQPPDFERWQDYSTQTIAGYWVGPASGTAKSDEVSVSTDSDGDGIMNFDEVKRFSLNAYDTDSDDDWVLDKQDMREYVFDNSGNYSKRSSDLDSDSLRKELDPDNDNDASPDGCEDTNYNGKYESGLGETNNFSAGSSQACTPLFDILYPLQTEAVNAGDHTDPDKILVQVSTAVPAGWTLSLTPGDFDVEIGGNSAVVLSVYPSADTYFLVVDPPTQSSAAFYDLNVSLAGSGSDSETNAVFYLPKSPNDEVIVMDRSGSMLTADKIGAAKNAANAFVDFLDDGDWVGVTSFASSASTDYPLTEILGDPERTAAMTAINSLSASGTTALGQGVQQGYGELTSAGNASHDWSLVLLSDGWENVPPYWADVSGSVTDAVVHTVALGEDADTSLLQSIAGAKHGNYFYVDVNPPSLAAKGVESAEALPSLAIANTLPNRLADAYLSIGELTHHYQRLFSELRSTANQETQIFMPSIPKGVPEAIFHANWDNPLGVMSFAVFNDPNGDPVVPDQVLQSETHLQYRVKDPMPGTWTIYVRVLKPSDELHFSVSGKSDTSLIAAVGGDPEKRTVGVPVPIYGILTDNKPIPGADVYALVSGSGIPVEPGVANVSGSTILQLFDDGNHGDGKADDGVYANNVTGISEPGGYTVKVAAAGMNNNGETFLRYASTGFNVRPRAAYIMQDGLDTALNYEALLEGRGGWSVDILTFPDVCKTNFDPYSLILIGPETGSDYDFDDPDVAGCLAQWFKPFIGLGEGGAALFDDFDLFTSYGQTWFSSNNNVYPVAPATAFWNEPFFIDTREAPLVQLYPKPLLELGVYIPQAMKTVLPIAREEKDPDHYPVVLETRTGQEFVFWGYNAGPQAMTEDGEKLLLNLAYYLR